MKPSAYGFIRCYQNPWTAGLVLFELIGAALIGLHARNTALWPFLLWLVFAPFVRTFYLQKLHKGSLSILKLARVAYVMTGWLFLTAVPLGGAVIVIFAMLAHLHAMVQILASMAGLWGVAPAIVLLATLIVAAVVMLFLWLSLAPLVFIEAVLDPAAGGWLVVRRGLSLINRRPLAIMAITSLQALFVVFALGSQLAKRSGIALLPAVWPATFFGPIALSILLVMAESVQVSQSFCLGASVRNKT